MFGAALIEAFEQGKVLGDAPQNTGFYRRWQQHWELA